MSDDEDRVEELLRVNAELAAEVRDLSSGRAREPRRRLAPAGRRLSRLVAERDSLAAERDSLAAQLETTEAERQRLERHKAELNRGMEEQAAELARLRAGTLGLLRRAIAKLLRRLG